MKEPKSIFTSNQQSRGSQLLDIIPKANSTSSADSVVPPPPPSYSALEEGAKSYVTGRQGIKPDPPAVETKTSTNSQSNEHSIAESTPHAFFRQPDQSTALIASSKHPLKHSRSESNERPVKRTRPRFKPRHTLNPDTFSKSFPVKIVASPPSPLFFSNTDHPRPSFPRFSSAEAAAIMLKNTRDDLGGMSHTLRLARGSISNSASPPRSSPTRGWASIEGISERSATPKSPGKLSGMQILGNVGILELLEQDERPTFIVDVANLDNFKPGGPLKIIFANASLRAYEVSTFYSSFYPLALTRSENGLQTFSSRDFKKFLITLLDRSGDGYGNLTIFSQWYICGPQNLNF